MGLGEATLLKLDKMQYYLNIIITYLKNSALERRENVKTLTITHIREYLEEDEVAYVRIRAAGRK